MTTEPRTAVRPVVEIKNLHKSFGDNHVLRGIDFTVNQREVVCIMARLQRW